MVVYDGELIKIEPVYGETEDQIIEMWATFRIDKYEIETFLDNYYVVPRKNLLEGISKHFNITIVLMAYDLYRINIEEKMLKQISTFPMDPLYVVMGQVVEAGEIKTEVYRGEKTKTRVIKIDCGILLDTKVDGWVAEQLQVGDYVAIVGKMFGEIVDDGREDKG